LAGRQERAYEPGGQRLEAGRGHAKSMKTMRE
jgi:hypothetical protein